MSLAEDAAEREQVRPSSLAPSAPESNPPTAPQIRSLVLDRPIRRRLAPLRFSERNAAVHWCPDRARVHPDWYLLLSHYHVRTVLMQSCPANTAHDLETFAAHAGRRAINTDDVMLLTRRNEALEEMLKGELERMKEAEGRAAGGGQTAKAARGRPAGRGKGKGKA
jgi:hypothetical protein